MLGRLGLGFCVLYEEFEGKSAQTLDGLPLVAVTVELKQGCELSTQGCACINHCMP